MTTVRLIAPTNILVNIARFVMNVSTLLNLKPWLTCVRHFKTAQYPILCLETLVTARRRASQSLLLIATVTAWRPLYFQQPNIKAGLPILTLQNFLIGHYSSKSISSGSLTTTSSDTMNFTRVRCRVLHLVQALLWHQVQQHNLHHSRAMEQDSKPFCQMYLAIIDPSCF